jgi:hypothetical protein
MTTPSRRCYYCDAPLPRHYDGCPIPMLSLPHGKGEGEEVDKRTTGSCSKAKPSLPCSEGTSGGAGHTGTVGIFGRVRGHRGAD